MLTDVFTADTSGLFILILAVIGITGEWRHHTITSSLLAAPDRIRFLAAKMIAFAAAGLVLSLVISLAIGIVGLVDPRRPRPARRPTLGDLIAQFARNAMVAALLAAFGVGLGALVRNQVVAIVGVLVLSFIVEPALIGLVDGRRPLRAVRRAADGRGEHPAREHRLRGRRPAGRGGRRAAHARVDRRGVRGRRRAAAGARPRVSRTVGEGRMSYRRWRWRTLHSKRSPRRCATGSDGRSPSRRPAQAQAWPAIATGAHTLISAPTGSGKTLAAFLWALDRLVAEPSTERTRLVYVSPLKALSYDVEKNLRAPLRGIGADVRSASAPATRRRRTGATWSATRRTSSSRRPSRST